MPKKSKYIPSIMQSGTPECYLCHKKNPPFELHHAIPGSMRERADKDGLTVYLCRFHHERLHTKGEFDRALQVEAQRCFIKKYSREEWFEHYGKFYE